MTKKKVKIRRSSISLDSEVAKIIDVQRGLIPRSRYIDHLLRKQLGLMPKKPIAE